jgi:predicted GIY-YIG superfamily endonuclease
MSLSERSESKTPWFVYIAQANTGRYYVGITNNPEKRVSKHNSGEGSQFARDQGPFKLVYVSESFANKSEARKREIQLKGWTRQKKEKLINGEWR